MISTRKISAFAISALLALGLAGAAAQEAFTPPSTPEEAVRMRVATMRENGALLRTAGMLTGAEAVAAARTILDNYAELPDLFPEGSTAGSDALPTIWQDWASFTAIIETGRSAAEAALAAAEAGDIAGYNSELGTVMRTCGQCHQQFRS